MTGVPLKLKVQSAAAAPRPAPFTGHFTVAFYTRERKIHVKISSLGGGVENNSCGCFGFSPLSWIP